MLRYKFISCMQTSAGTQVEASSSEPTGGRGPCGRTVHVACGTSHVGHLVYHGRPRAVWPHLCMSHRMWDSSWARCRLGLSDSFVRVGDAMRSRHSR